MGHHPADHQVRYERVGPEVDFAGMVKDKYRTAYDDLLKAMAGDLGAWYIALAPKNRGFDKKTIQRYQARARHLADDLRLVLEYRRHNYECYFRLVIGDG
jgi:hypothetical protein